MTATAILGCLDSLQAAVDDFLKHADNGGLESLSEDEYLEVAREVEAARSQLATADYPIIAGVETRGLPERHLARNAAGLLSGLWRMTPHEAKARVMEATALAPRTTSALS